MQLLSYRGTGAAFTRFGFWPSTVIILSNNRMFNIIVCRLQCSYTTIRVKAPKTTTENERPKRQLFYNLMWFTECELEKLK